MMRKLLLNIVAAWLAIGAAALVLPREYWWCLPIATALACVAHATAAKQADKKRGLFDEKD